MTDKGAEVGKKLFETVVGEDEQPPLNIDYSCFDLEDKVTEPIPTNKIPPKPTPKPIPQKEIPKPPPVNTKVSEPIIERKRNISQLEQGYFLSFLSFIFFFFFSLSICINLFISLETVQRNIKKDFNGQIDEPFKFWYLNSDNQNVTFKDQAFVEIIEG